MGLLLFIVARFLQWLLTPIFFLYAVLRYRNINRISEYFHDVAFSIDQMGNVMGAPIMNDVLLKKDSEYKFGNPDFTISHVIGYNYLDGKLTRAGKFVAWCLNMVDENHVEDAAKNEQ